MPGLSLPLPSRVFGLIFLCLAAGRAGGSGPGGRVPGTHPTAGGPSTVPGRHSSWPPAGPPARPVHSPPSELPAGARWNESLSLSLSLSLSPSLSLPLSLSLPPSLPPSLSLPPPLSFRPSLCLSVRPSVPPLPRWSYLQVPPTPLTFLNFVPPLLPSLPSSFPSSFLPSLLQTRACTLANRRRRGRRRTCRRGWTPTTSTRRFAPRLCSFEPELCKA